MNKLLFLLAGVLVLLLQGCTQTAEQPAQSPATLDRCCTDMEDYPRWFVDVSRLIAPQLGGVLGNISWRDGHLKSRQSARTAILASLEPLDIIMVSSKGRTSGRVIPGLFGHAAIYLGTQSELQDLGVWTSNAVKPHAADIRNGMVFIEADQKGVHLSPPSVTLNTDRVAILRPQLRTIGQKRAAARGYFRAVGSDFDFLFDVDSPDCTFCTELIHRVMPVLDLPIQSIYGVRTIMPDRVVVAALRGEVPLKLIAYIKADLNTWRPASGKALARDIATTWSRRQR